MLVCYATGKKGRWNPAEQGQGKQRMRLGYAKVGRIGYRRLGTGNGMGRRSFQAAVAGRHDVVGGQSVSTLGSGVETESGGDGREVLVMMDGGMAVRGSALSVVRRPRSLMVSFCGFVPCSGSGISSCVWDEMGPLDSSEELSVHSGVESESKRGIGERRFLARGRSSSSSPSRLRLGLGRFLNEVWRGMTVTTGSPVWGPALLRTEE